MKIKYRVLFKGKANQKFTIDDLIFEAGKEVYFDVLPSMLRKHSKYLDIKKIVILEKADKVDKDILNKKGTEVIKFKDLPKKYIVTFVGADFEKFVLCLNDYLKRGESKEVTKEQATEIKKLGGEFEVVEETVI